VQGGIIYSFFSICYFSAISIIPTSLAVLLFYIYPIFVAVLSFLINGEKITKKIIFSILVSFIGLILLFGQNFNNLNKVGIFLALGAALSYGIYAVYGRHILNTIPLSVTTAYICLYAAITFFAAGLYKNKLTLNFTPVSWLYVTLITLITVGGFLSFFIGIKLTSPTIVSILGMTEPIMTIFLSFILFSEQFSFIQIIGVILVLTASTQVLFKKQKKIIKKY
jgi:drug/metabolite transporter (DMT)-like permease